MAAITVDREVPIVVAYKSKVRKKNQVTLDKEQLDLLKLHEGDVIEWAVVDGKLVGTPMETIRKEQSWYWTAEWQAEEREVDEWVAGGGLSNATIHLDPTEGLKSLRERVDAIIEEEAPSSGKKRS
jgi:antitoxin MazE